MWLTVGSANRGTEEIAKAWSWSVFGWSEGQEWGSGVSQGEEMSQRGARGQSLEGLLGHGMDLDVFLDLF